ncbi:hypothetical protein GF1_17420 [Desulfolithobacter dissulfuricans]|uniref:Uncharacterized protein n=1 Tax=Desulfolithobacter dissulfuricans TaxID=2795293 RepID=A0A915U9W5_9BACT|nr:hypothetical protein GF1_17420 [Desulfolithobacter dissulfuricans]
MGNEQFPGGLDDGESVAAPGNSEQGWTRSISSGGWLGGSTGGNSYYRLSARLTPGTGVGEEFYTEQIVPEDGPGMDRDLRK